MADVRERPRRAPKDRPTGDDGRRRREQPADQTKQSERGERPERSERPGRDERPERESRQRRVNPAVVGACLAGLMLVAYFVWLSIEMGAHSVTGGAPMIAVFVASGLGLAGGALGFIIGRRRD